MDCPQCHTGLPRPVKFCPQCGAPVSAPSGPVYPQWAPLPVETRGDSLAAAGIIGSMIGGAAGMGAAIVCAAVPLVSGPARGFFKAVFGLSLFFGCFYLVIPAGAFLGGICGLILGLRRARANRT